MKNSEYLMRVYDFFCTQLGLKSKVLHSYAESSTEEVVKLNDQPHHHVCPNCQEPIIILKHTVICGCGSKIKNKVKFKIYPEKLKSPHN